MQDDFLCLSGSGSTHILNAISPAFTASFALADLILDQAQDSLNVMKKKFRAILLAAGLGTRLVNIENA